MLLLDEPCAALDIAHQLSLRPFPSRLVALDAYTLATLTAEYPVTDRIAVTLRGENLLDETATDVFGYNGPGAGVFVGLKLR